MFHYLLNSMVMHIVKDTNGNSIAKYNYPKLEPQHLDYILLDRDHAQPSSWHNDTHRVKSPEWSVKSWGKTYKYNDYSDHYHSGYASNEYRLIHLIIKF